MSRIPCLLGCLCDLRREGVSFIKYCFAAQLKVVECNSFRNVHLWVYYESICLCVFTTDIQIKGLGGVVVRKRERGHMSHQL